MSKACIVATMAGNFVADGVIPTSAQEKIINSDPHSATKYAKGLNQVDSIVEQEFQNSQTAQALRTIGDTTNSNVSRFWRVLHRPSDVLNPNIIHEVEALFSKFTEIYPKGNYADWKRDFAPLVDKVIDKYSDIINADPKLTHMYNDYLDKFVRVGGNKFSQYQYPSAVARAVNKLSEGPLSALISNNPFIAYMNLFEVAPKSMAWASMNLGNDLAASTSAMFRAMVKVAKESKGNPTQRIKELDDIGLYGSFDTSSNPLLRKMQESTGITDLIDVTENPFRSFLYYLGEDILGPGGGMKAVSDNAFIYAPHDVPFYLQGATNKGLFGLSRFTIGSTLAMESFIKHAYKGVKAGDLSAALPVVAFAAMQALQTGTTSVVPAYFWPALPQDVKDQMKELDANTPFNMVGKLTGQDYSEYTRLGAIALGLPTQIVEGTLKTGVSGLKNVASGIASANPEQIIAGAALTTSAAASLGVGGVNIAKWNIPHWAGNFTLQKVFREWVKVTSEEIEREDYGSELLKATKLLPQGLQ